MPEAATSMEVARSMSVLLYLSRTVPIAVRIMLMAFA